MRLFSTVGVSAERPSGFGHVGVALATSTVALVNFLALTFLMRRKIKRIEGRMIVSSLVKILIASLFMSAACYGTYYLLSNYFTAKTLFVQFAEALVPILVGGIVFLFAAKILGVKELNQAINAVKQKFKRK